MEFLNFKIQNMKWVLEMECMSRESIKSVQILSVERVNGANYTWWKKSGSSKTSKAADARCISMLRMLHHGLKRLKTAPLLNPLRLHLGSGNDGSGGVRFGPTTSVAGASHVDGHKEGSLRGCRAQGAGRPSGNRMKGQGIPGDPRGGCSLF